MGYENELRLLYAIALNAVALAAGYRFATRRVGGDLLRRLIDAGLIYYLLQYVVIGALGVVGLLSPWTIGPLALMCSAMLWAGSGWQRREMKVAPPISGASRGERAVVAACLAFVIAYAGAYVYQQRSLPPTADDALTYHLPAAVQWLQTGRIDLFPTWFFNPANTYSPLGGSVFMAWLIAPVGSDVLVRYVQVGPLILLFLVVVEIARLLGARDATAALVATACVMTRSFINQVIVPKDDLFLTVFALAAVMSLAPRRADERWSPWRAGVAVGLLLSIKYTAIYSLPILLLMLDVPLHHPRFRRRGGRIIALASAALLAGPWYVRNAMLTGNPLFPIDVQIAGVHVLKGLFATSRSNALARPGGIIDTLVGGRGFYGPPPSVMGLVMIAWVAAIIVLARAVLRDALWRACVLGSMISVALFALTSPYAEVRFVYPAIALLFATFAGVVARIPRRADLIAAAALLGVTFVTTLHGGQAKQGFALAGIIVAGAIAVLILFTPPRYAPRAYGTFASAVVVALAAFGYVNWSAYLKQYELGRFDACTSIHGDIGNAWRAVAQSVPPGSVIAYTGTHYVYPLQGPSMSNRVVYVPARPELRVIQDLPPSPNRLAGEQIPDYFSRQTNAGADAKTWRANLAASRASVLVLAKSAENPPPELTFIDQKPESVELLHDDPAAAVYRIRDTGLLGD